MMQKAYIRNSLRLVHPIQYNRNPYFFDLSFNSEFEKRLAVSLALNGLRTVCCGLAFLLLVLLLLQCIADLYGHPFYYFLPSVLHVRRQCIADLSFGAPSNCLQCIADLYAPFYYRLQLSTVTPSVLLTCPTAPSTACICVYMYAFMYSDLYCPFY
eukprot:gene29598-12536_t